MKKHVQILTTLLICLCMMGCATANSINRNYSNVKNDDGISYGEAKIIAKKALMDSPEKGLYRIFAPKILRNSQTYHHPGYHFVLFDRKSLKVASSDFLVVIHKKTGEVVYAEKKYPSYVRGYQWVFNLHEAKKNNNRKIEALTSLKTE